MKKLFAIATLPLLFGLQLLAQESRTNAPASESPIKISATEAKAHSGAEVIVTGKVAEVNQNDRILRFNFEKPYPDNAFTAVVFSANSNQFEHPETFKGKTVQVRGTIKDYHGHPEIILTKSNQLQVVEKATKPKE
jgi:DNA/RNA endonuclease YhcR with UshA esterase domain